MRILVVHVAGIGDAVMASTVVARLRAEWPDARISWMCSVVVAPLVALYDGVTETIVVDQQALFRGGPWARLRAIAGVWRRIVGRGFDRVLMLHVDPRFRVLTLPLIAVPTLALSRDRSGDMIPVPGRFLGDEYARLVGGTKHVGPIERRYDVLNLRAKVQQLVAASATTIGPGRQRRVVLVPGGTRNALREDVLRRWPVDHYAWLARELIAAGLEVALVGNAQDTWVRPSFDGIAVTDLLGALSLPETLRFMADSDLVISHDTGPMHLARLVRAPLVALFGPTDPAHFVLPDDTVTVLWGGAELACRPCYDGRETARCTNNICLGRLLPQQVLQHALARLAD